MCINMMQLSFNHEPIRTVPENALTCFWNNISFFLCIVMFATFRYVLFGDHPERLTPL